VIRAFYEIKSCNYKSRIDSQKLKSVGQHNGKQRLPAGAQN
jgi:hypothetical protein